MTSDVYPDRMTTGQFNRLIASSSALEQSLLYQLISARFPPPVREYTFHPLRRWRFDLAWPDIFVATEVEGGTYRKSRHTSADGFYKDCQKYNTAGLMGWRVFRFDSKMVNNGEALECLKDALGIHALNSPGQHRMNSLGG